MSAYQHETDAITFIRDATEILEGARNEANHGGYEDAIRSVRDARDRLVSAELELRKARDAAVLPPSR